MSNRISINSLLNPTRISSPPPNAVDIRPNINTLLLITGPLSNDAILAPPHLAEHLRALVEFLGASPSDSSLRSPRSPLNVPAPRALATSPAADITKVNLTSPPSFSPQQRETRFDVVLNAKTTLVALHIYEDVGACIEYPETSEKGPVGHLFRIDPRSEQRPTHNIVYSLGRPSGMSKKGLDVTSSLLLNMSTRELVPCIERHSTCEYTDLIDIEPV